MVNKKLTKPDGAERVLIVQRPDGAYTYRKQYRVTSGRESDDDLWSPQGPDCGIYDSVDTAETEAMQCVDWLKAGFH